MTVTSPSISLPPSISNVAPLVTLTFTSFKISSVNTKAPVPAVTLNVSVAAEPTKSPVNVPPPCCSKVSAVVAPEASNAAVAPLIVPALTNVLFVAKTSASMKGISSPSASAISSVLGPTET